MLRPTSLGEEIMRSMKSSPIALKTRVKFTALASVETDTHVHTHTHTHTQLENKVTGDGLLLQRQTSS